MNKYQEALDDIKCDSYNYIENNYEDGFKQCYKEQFDVLQELVDQTKTLTEEEIIKEWEALGYELIRHERRELIFKSKEDGTIFTMWNFNDIRYSKHWRERPANITIQEHQLLTKTFKMLGWEV